MGVLENIFLFFRVMCYIAYCYLEAFVRAFVPPPKKSISGEIVLVTGAGQGIGREIALQMAALGTTMVLWDVNKETNDSVAEEINQSGGKAFSYVCDVSSASEIAKVAAKVRQDVGEVTILINNAGVWSGGYFMDLDEQLIRRCFDINVLSHCWMDKEFLPDMIKKNHGHILNVASMAAYLPCPVLADYCSTKFAALGLADSLILELGIKGQTGIKVSTLCPMLTDTKMVAKHENLLSPLLTTKQVADAAVDGLLRNYEIITVDSSMYYFVKFIALLPRKAQSFLTTFGIIKFYPRDYKED